MFPSTLFHCLLLPFLLSLKEQLRILATCPILWVHLTDDEWTGAGTRGNRRTWNVPGAVHLEWLNLVNSDEHQTVKPATELRAMLKERVVTPDKQVITY